MLKYVLKVCTGFEDGLLSKGSAASQNHSWKYLEIQHLIYGSHSPSQQFSLSLVEAKMAGAESFCPKLVNSSISGGFHAEIIIWNSE